VTRYSVGERVVIRYGKRQGELATILKVQAAEVYVVKAKDGVVLYFSNKGLQQETVRVQQPDFAAWCSDRKISAMYHTIEFDEPLMLDLEVSPKQPLEKVTVKKGTRLRAQLKPYVMQTENGPVEVADLFFDDGTATRCIRFSSFSFVD